MRWQQHQLLAKLKGLLLKGQQVALAPSAVREQPFSTVRFAGSNAIHDEIDCPPALQFVVLRYSLVVCCFQFCCLDAQAQCAHALCCFHT